MGNRDVNIRYYTGEKTNTLPFDTVPNTVMQEDLNNVESGIELPNGKSCHNRSQDIFTSNIPCPSGLWCS